MSYPSTMGYTPYVRSSNIWHTGEGYAEFVRILKAHVKSLQPDNYNEINAQITWDDELEKHVQNIRIFGPSDLRPIPEAVNEAAIFMADVYVTRWRMHNRLATVRERTAVALDPRGAWEGDNLHRSELQHQTITNAHYRKYINYLQSSMSS